MTKESISIVVELWSIVLGFLSCFSPLELLRKLFKLRSHIWAEIWVLLNLVFSVLCLVFAKYTEDFLIPLLIYYGVLRIVEITVYLAKVSIFDPFDPNYTVRSYRRIVLLALHNYFEVIIWFAAAYCHWQEWFNKSEVLSTIMGSIYFSVLTMTTLGYGEINPSADPGRALVTIQLLIGIFITLVILARFIGYLPIPKTRDLQEKEVLEPQTEPKLHPTTPQ